jgi:hypothetical protein
MFVTLSGGTRPSCHLQKPSPGSPATVYWPRRGAEAQTGDKPSPMALTSFPKSTWLHPLYFDTSGRYVRKGTVTFTLPLLLLGSPSVALAPMVAMLVNS